MMTGAKRNLKLLLLRTMLAAGPLVFTLPATASALQWQKLTRTGRHDVALERQSVRLNASGRLVVWLRFVPRGEPQRRAAANEYGNKNYRLHLEQYEIDCGEKSAIMQSLDILGAGGKRLARLRGGGQPDVIIPDSVLDRAAVLVCPTVAESEADDEEGPEADAEQSTAEVKPDGQLTEEGRQRIADALLRTESEPGSFNVWVELGNAYYDNDMPRQAIEAYDRALAINPKSPDVLNDQGAMFRQAGDLSRSLANFEKALTIDPSNLESLYNLGYIYAMDLKRTDRALEFWQRYLKLDSSSATAQQVQTFVKRYGKAADSR